MDEPSLVKNYHDISQVYVSDIILHYCNIRKYLRYEYEIFSYFVWPGLSYSFDPDEHISCCQERFRSEPNRHASPQPGPRHHMRHGATPKPLFTAVKFLPGKANDSTKEKRSGFHFYSPALAICSSCP